MCVCMYVCMYVCIYVCMYVWMDGWMDGWIDVCMCVCMYVTRINVFYLASVTLKIYTQYMYIHTYIGYSLPTFIAYVR